MHVCEGFAINTFEASIILSLSDRVSAGLGAIAMSMTRTQTAADALQSRMNKIHSTFQRGLVMVSAGAAIAAPLVFATKAAMDLQTAMGRVQIATGASNEQMQELNETLTKTANATGIFSKPKLASFAADMYSSGIRQMDQINAMLPQMAKAADLMQIISHGKISAEDSAHTLVALSHQFGAYTQDKMAPIITAAVAIAPALPGGLKTLGGMGSYVNTQGFRNLHIEPQELMALQAAVATTSGGKGTGRGAFSGSNLINALQRSMPGVFGSGLLSGKSAFSAEVMGLAKGGVSQIFKDGKLNLQALFDKLTAFESLPAKQIAKNMMDHAGMLGKKAEEERAFLRNFLADKNAPKAQLVTSLLKNEYGSASGIAQLFGDKGFLVLLKSIQDSIKNAKSIDEMQAQAMEMLEPQLKRLQTNFTTLAATVGTQMLPVLTKVVTKMGDILDKVNAFADKHPQIVRLLVELTAVASAALTLGGVLHILWAGFQGLRFLMGALTPLGLTIAAVTLVIKNWDSIMKVVHANSNIIIHVMAVIDQGLRNLVRGFQQLGIAIGCFLEQMGHWIGAIPLIAADGAELENIGANLRDAMAQMSTVSAKQAFQDQSQLQRHGLGFLVDAAKGRHIDPTATAKLAKMPGPITNNMTLNTTVNAPKGTDANALAKAIGEHQQKFVKDLLHAANAGSGNATGRSNATGGATRP